MAKLVSMQKFFGGWGSIMVGLASIPLAAVPAVEEMVRGGNWWRIGFWLFAYACLGVYTWSLWSRLRPAVAISDSQTREQAGICSVRIKNISEASCHCSVRLIAINPSDDGVSLPVQLPSANSRDGFLVVAGNGEETVQVFRMSGEDRMEIVRAGSGGIPVKAKFYTFTLQPFSDDGVSGESKTFWIMRDSQNFRLGVPPIQGI